MFLKISVKYHEYETNTKPLRLPKIFFNTSFKNDSKIIKKIFVSVLYPNYGGKMKKFH